MRVLITGASSGIGYEIAKQYLQNGHYAILVSRSEEKLRKIKEQYNENCEYIVLDVTNRKEVFEKLKDINCDILVNNAGLALGKDDLKDLSLDDMDTMIDTNIKGVVNITRAILPKMIENNKGHIVFMGSTAAIQGYKGGSIYCATKASVKTIADALRIELIETDIRVTNIQPGIVKTDFSLVRFKGDKNKADSVYDGIDAISPEDVARTVYFATSLPNRVQLTEITMMANHQATGSMIHYKK